MDSNIVPIRPESGTPQPFDFRGNSVRVVTVDGKPWFVASDVAQILGYRMASDLTRSLDEKHRGTHPVRTPSGEQDMAVISEPGLYRAIGQRQTGRMVDDERRAFIEAFQEWVYDEVIPSIRANGSYGAPKELTFEEMVERTLLESRARIQALESTVQELEPPAKAWNDLSRAIGDFVIADAAKIVARAGCKTGPGRLHKQIEHEWNWMFRRGEKNKRVVRQEVIDKGYMVARITSGYIDQVTGERKQGTPEPRVTVKGIGEIARRLGGDADLAMSEATEEIRTQEAEATA